MIKGLASLWHDGEASIFNSSGLNMSPLAHEEPEEGSPPPRVFIQRLVREVPSLQDALMLYNTTKVFCMLCNAILIESSKLPTLTRNGRLVHISKMSKVVRKTSMTWTFACDMSVEGGYSSQMFNNHAVTNRAKPDRRSRSVIPIHLRILCYSQTQMWSLFEQNLTGLFPQC